MSETVSSPAKWLKLKQFDITDPMSVRPLDIVVDINLIVQVIRGGTNYTLDTGCGLVLAGGRYISVTAGYEAVLELLAKSGRAEFVEL